MKKLSFTLCLLLAALLAFSACTPVAAPGSTGDDSEKGLVGKWYLTSAEAQGVEVPEDALGTMGLMSIEFKEDGTATFSISGVSGDGSYTETDTEVSIGEGDSGITLQKVDSALVYENAGSKLRFTRN